MKHISRQLPFCAVVFFAFCAVTFAQEKVEIKNVWSEGRYTIRQEIFNSRIDSIVETRAVVGKTQTRGQFVWQVDAAAPRADGVQVLTLKATRVALRYEQDALTPYSSDSGDMLNADDYEKNVYEIFQNSPIVVSIKDGAVLKVEGCEEFWAKVPEPKSERATLFHTLMKGLATVSGFGEVFTQLDYPLPSGAVAVGDAWEKTVKIQAGISDSVLWKCKREPNAKSGRDELAALYAEAVLTLPVANSAAKITIEAKYNVEQQIVAEFGAKTAVSVSREVTLGEGDDAETFNIKTISLIRNNLVVAKR